MKSDEVLKEAANLEGLIKKVSDQVRYVIKRQPTIDPYELPEEGKAGRTAQYVLSQLSTSLSQMCEPGRMEWTAEETRVIEEAFKSYERPPTSATIRSIFNST